MGILKLLIAGWKSISLVDVQGHPVFTLWTCKCNLKCPFCHNWRLADADPQICKYVDVDFLIEEIQASKNLVDYLHVTGGEPLVQKESLAVLFEKSHAEGVLNSLNSNLTLYQPLKELVEKGLVDHVATDLKYPPEELYGLPASTARMLWREFKESLKLLKQQKIPLELRVPVHAGLSSDLLRSVLEELSKYLSIDSTIVVLNQIVGEPLVSPRNLEWVRKHIVTNEERFRELAEAVKSLGFSKVYVKSIPGFRS